ncbi:putative ICE-like protease (caspase) p20 domain-containing protein [Neospora caninum Liverpool]|uniref:ICE-like protease (Caspase) p20 domain-containing protein, putative n=1 Tax=Neospora caninum (strain Liverpool) TaxID=572307 RepID=F0VRD0_NEOCL|nr:putative ICE-like protease (caspase) p20 domain-containing protein [Neospora caninum Liverpool]CBZ56278.1 putative ICE-like protease (caspase) p20 domain-containing protein [Neospora caninum Liverpool]CEL71041.1 TPA: ICE-like protease (caspase) p20 domain-containing protein, putative [Neospora caninum Liverpool]|eukprot:XP_003886303.1 putative ICE-like protease (caspase) p20 domain-containing protein [Neospora caninum Liverpool]
MTSYTPHSYTSSSLDTTGAPASFRIPPSFVLSGGEGAVQAQQNGVSETLGRQPAGLYYYPVNTVPVSSEGKSDGDGRIHLPMTGRYERNLPAYSSVTASYPQGNAETNAFVAESWSASSVEDGAPQARGHAWTVAQAGASLTRDSAQSGLASRSREGACRAFSPSVYTSVCAQPATQQLLSGAFSRSTASLVSEHSSSSRLLCHPTTSWSCPAAGPAASDAPTYRRASQPGPLAVFPPLPIPTASGLPSAYSLAEGRRAAEIPSAQLGADRPLGGRPAAAVPEDLDGTLKRLEAAKAFEASRLQDLVKQEKELLMHFAQRHQAGNSNYARSLVAERSQQPHVANEHSQAPVKSTRVFSGVPTAPDGSAFVAQPQPQGVSAQFPEFSTPIPRLPSFSSPHVGGAGLLPSAFPSAFPTALGQPSSASFILPTDRLSGQQGSALPVAVRAPPSRGPRRRALIVGCGHQKGQPYHIRGAGNDAHLFAHACVQFLGIDPKEICVLTDTAPSTCYRGRGRDGSLLGPAAYIQGKDGSKHGSLLARQDNMHAATDDKSDATSALSQAMREVAGFGSRHFGAAQGRSGEETKAVVHSVVDVDGLESEEPNPVVSELPTRHNILRGLRWLVEDARCDDYLIFYFSGHSVQMDNMSGWEGEGYEEAFVPCDFNIRDVESGDPVSLVGALEVREILFNIPDRTQLTIFLDCCGGQTVLDPAGSLSRFTFIKGVKQRGMWPFSDPTDKMCLAKYRPDVWASPDMHKQVVQPRYIPAVEVQSLSCVSTASVKGDEHEKPGLLNAYCVAAAPWGSVALEASFNSFSLRSFHTRSLPGDSQGSCTVESKPVVHGVFTWALVSALASLVEETIRVFSDEGGARNGCVPIRVTYKKLMEKIEQQISDLKWNRLFKLDQQPELTVHSGGGARPNEVFIQFPELAPGKGRPSVGAALSTLPGGCLRRWCTEAFDSPLSSLQEMSGSFYDFFHPQWTREEELRMQMRRDAAAGALPYTAEACFQRAFGASPDTLGAVPRRAHEAHAKEEAQKANAQRVAQGLPQRTSGTLSFYGARQPAGESPGGRLFSPAVTEDAPVHAFYGVEVPDTRGSHGKAVYPMFTSVSTGSLDDLNSKMHGGNLSQLSTSQVSTGGSFFVGTRGVKAGEGW